ncbi:MAG TPA: cytochrome c family protein [Burkholderiaceae bacterium]|nr:cytochrome c family protein [Burkholderiaceae bacterium]
MACATLVTWSHASSAGGDAERGEAIYERCVACHSLDRNRTGPKHCGLLGRRAGSLSDFEYSPAMRAAGIVWNERTLDRFLAAPTKVVPGTSMGYAGIDDPRERADLIAWLREASRSDRYCGPTR